MCRKATAMRNRQGSNMMAMSYLLFQMGAEHSYGERTLIFAEAASVAAAIM